MNILLRTSDYRQYRTSLFEKLGIERTVVLTECVNYSNSDNVVDTQSVIKTLYLSQDDFTSLTDSLVNLGVLKSTDNGLEIAEDNIISLITDNNIDLSSIKSTLNIKQSKRTKKEAIKSATLSHLKTTNEELLSAYSNWYDSATTRGLLTANQIELNEALLDKFTQKDLDIALEVLEIATRNSYKDLQWAINTYQKTHSSYNTQRKYIYNNPAQNLVDTTSNTNYNQTVNISSKGY